MVLAHLQGTTVKVSVIYMYTDLRKKVQDRINIICTTDIMMLRILPSAQARIVRHL